MNSGMLGRRIAGWGRHENAWPLVLHELLLPLRLFGREWGKVCTRRKVLKVRPFQRSYLS